MPTYTFQFLRLDPPGMRLTMPEVSMLPESDPTQLIGRGTVNSLSKGGNEYELRWVDERKIRVMQEDSIGRTVAVAVMREAYIKIIAKYNMLLATGLRHQYSRALSLLWSHKQRPAFNHVHFDLRALLLSEGIIAFARERLINVIVSGLPLEQIPCATVIIEHVGLREILDLVSNTPAAIKQITLSPRESIIRKLQINANGWTRIICDTDTCQEASAQLENAMKAINIWQEN